MKKLTLATTVLAATAALTAINANAYQGEVAAGYQYLDADSGSNLDGFTGSATGYFKNVETRNSPLAEAAYLDQASNVNVNGSYASNNGQKVNSIEGNVQYYIPNSKFVVAGGVGQGRVKTDGSSVTSRTTYYNGEVGYLPAPGLTVAVGAQGTQVKDGKDRVDPTLRAKYVTSLSNGHDINLEAKGVFGNEDSKVYTVGGDYYLDKTLSVGVDYKDNANYDDNQEVGIRAKKFITPQLSVDGRVGFGDNYNTYGVGANYRF